MTVKEELLAYIDDLADDDALSLWHRIQCENATPVQPLTAADKAAIERGLAELRAGKGIPHAEVMRRLGIAE